MWLWFHQMDGSSTKEYGMGELHHSFSQLSFSKGKLEKVAGQKLKLVLSTGLKMCDGFLLAASKCSPTCPSVVLDFCGWKGLLEQQNSP